mmetsp:Transcript_40573/g.107537  ORF Transcript_40573/g.107537 Transcript_40573/m.107537 type:complete len:202 (+) Transcript_40573:110-715(+)
MKHNPVKKHRLYRATQATCEGSTWMLSSTPGRAHPTKRLALNRNLHFTISFKGCSRKSALLRLHRLHRFWASLRSDSTDKRRHAKHNESAKDQVNPVIVQQQEGKEPDDNRCQGYVQLVLAPLVVLSEATGFLPESDGRTSQILRSLIQASKLRLSFCHGGHVFLHHRHDIPHLLLHLINCSWSVLSRHAERHNGRPQRPN